MLAQTKERFYQFLKKLGYNVTDNGTYREAFPWLMLRTGSAQVLKSHDLDMTDVRLIVDIFSTYNGEKEILDIVDNINHHVRALIDEYDDLQFCYMRSLRIIDDKETGPCRKHGVVTFSFIMIREDDGDGNNTEGD